jgi:hypothetical protein
MVQLRRYVVGSGNRKSAARQAGSGYLLKQAERFTGRMARRGGRYLGIPGVARQLGDSFEFTARRYSIICRIVSIRRVEQVYIATRRIEA